MTFITDNRRTETEILKEEMQEEFDISGKLEKLISLVTFLDEKIEKVEERLEEKISDERITAKDMVEHLKNLKGEKGEQGEKGEKGDLGPLGKSIKGNDGLRGEQGPQGLVGPPGPKGEDGIPGKDGKDGISPLLEEIVKEVLTRVPKPMQFGFKPRQRDLWISTSTTNGTLNGTVNGSNRVFTIPAHMIPASETVVVDGIPAHISRDYSIADRTFTFVTAPILTVDIKFQKL